jgi:hypothetical protein
MNLYVAAGAALLAVAYSGALVYGGRQWGLDSCEAAKAREERLVKEASDAASKAAAQAIANLEIKHTTIKQTLEKEVRVIRDYGACKHSPDGLRALNDTLTNGAKRPGDSSVPRADAPKR